MYCSLSIFADSSVVFLIKLNITIFVVHPILMGDTDVHFFEVAGDARVFRVFLFIVKQEEMLTVVKWTHMRFF